MEESKETEGRRRQENRNRRRRQNTPTSTILFSLSLLMRYHHRRTAEDASALLIDARAADASSTLLASCFGVLPPFQSRPTTIVDTLLPGLSFKESWLACSVLHVRYFRPTRTRQNSEFSNSLCTCTNVARATVSMVQSRH